MAVDEVDILRENTYIHVVGNQKPNEVLKTLYNAVGDSYWDVAAILYHIKTKEIYKQADHYSHYEEPGRHQRYDRKGHSGWRDYCDNETPVSYRSVQYWINIYEYFTKMGIDKARATEIGWHKAKLLVNVTDDVGILESLISAAKEQSIEDLKATVQDFNTVEGTDTREVVRNKKFTFVVQEATGDNMQTILDAAVKGTETNGYNEAFVRICTEWYQQNLQTLIRNGHVVVVSPDTIVEEPEPEETSEDIEEVETAPDTAGIEV